MAKVDLKREMGQLYKARKGEPELVEVPSLAYVMVDGAGDPNEGQAFQEAVEALYGVSFTLKFMLKRAEEPVDHVVMPLEGLWWTEDMEEFRMDRRADWLWTLMILQPEQVTEGVFRQACEELERKKDPPALSLARFEEYHEGLSAQVMHMGPYDEEGPTIARLHEYIRKGGYGLRGKHHEIYLGDPRRTAPERLRTIIRQPVE